MIPYTEIRHLDIFGYNLGVETFMLSLSCIIFILVLIWSLKAHKVNLNPNKDFSMFILIFIIIYCSAILGARIAFYIFPWKGLAGIVGFLNLDPKGLTSYGAFLGGAVGIFLCYLLFKNRIFSDKKTNIMHIYRFFDVFVVPFSLAIAVSRIGCFFDGHIVGKPTDLPWCIEVSGNCTHPVALYFMLSALLVFIILVFFFTKPLSGDSKIGKRFDSETALWFIFLYFSTKFFFNFFVQGKSFDFEQWVSLALILFSLLHLIDDYLLIFNEKIRTADEFESFMRSNNLEIMPYMFWKIWDRGKSNK